MTSRIEESPDSSCYARSDSISNDVSLGPRSEEVCPVVDDNGSICGETKTLSVFKEFRQIYDDCIRRMECNKDDNTALRKLAPFRKLVEDLWEQNAMLVETVEELEQEATCRVTQLQSKLDQCSEKVNEYLEDIDSLVEVIRRFREKGILDSTGLKFHTLCDLDIHGYCKSSCLSPVTSQEVKPKEKNARNSKGSARRQNLTDTTPATNTSDCVNLSFSSISSSQNASSQSQSPSRSSCSELSSKIPSKTPHSSDRPKRANCGCIPRMPYKFDGNANRNYMPNAGKLYPEYEKKQEGSEENSSNEGLRCRCGMKAEEVIENESYYSAVGCHHGKKGRRDKKLDEGSQLALYNRKYERKAVKKSPDSNRGGYLNFQAQPMSCLSYSPGRYGDKATDIKGGPININFNLISDTSCFENMLNDCACDCNSCGGHLED